MSLSLLFAAARSSPTEIARRVAASPAARALRDAAVAALRAADRVCRAYAARRLAREMRDWPDERLEDIGLTRAELADAIRGVKQPFRWTPAIDPEAPPISRARR
jgi:hypothetical protein